MLFLPQSEGDRPRRPAVPRPPVVPSPQNRLLFCALTSSHHDSDAHPYPSFSSQLRVLAESTALNMDTSLASMHNCTCTVGLRIVASD